MQPDERSKILREMPMGKLIPKVSIPIMISMLVQALYNIVDSIFVSRYDPNALTAVSLAFPLQMLMIAVSVGLGTGVNSLVSRRLGRKDREGARQACGNGMLLELCGYVLFLIFGLFFARGAFSLLTADPVLQSLGSDYLEIVSVMSFGLFFAVLFERFMQSTGNSVLSMVTQFSGAITNIILDPIMIFGLLGFPALGIKGAAIATVIGQIVSCALGFILNQTRNKELLISVKYFRPEAKTIKEILSVGLPSILMQSISSVMNTLFNLILTPFGNTAISVLGVYFKLQSFVFMPVFGLSNGLVAVLGYNYGARLKKRIYASIKVTLKWAVVIMALGVALFLLLPDILLEIFEGEAGELTMMGAPALRIICSHFLLAAVGITMSTTFQATGHGIYSMIVSLLRQLFVLIPAAWLLSRLGGFYAVWWSFPIAESVALTICLILFNTLNKKYIKPLPDEADVI